MKPIEDILTKLRQDVIDRGFYNPYDVFNHDPKFYKEPERSRYDYKVHIVKWNTRSTRMVILGAKWNDNKNKFIISTYKMNSIKRTAHGEKMR